MIRLLLVDDEPLMLTVSKTFLEKDDADIECDTCSAAQEALEKLAVSSYDAIVSDYDMPEMDGIALLKAVRKADPDLPFILLTGRGREEVVIEALNYGADFYLQKSLEPKVLYAELASKIGYAVDRHRARESLRESERSLAAELDTAQRLQQVSTQLIQADRIEALYEQILDTAVMIMKSDFASIQMLSPERGTVGELLLLGYRGFNPEAARFWKWVRPDSESSCGKALRTRQRVIVPDIQHCEFLAGSADQETYLQTGIHAVQTTPLISRSGTLLGMISTHWRQPHEPTANELRSFDVLARQAADLIYRTWAEETLRKQAEMFQRLIDTIPAMIIVFDPKLQKFQFNRALREILGWTEEYASKDDFMAMAFPDPEYRAQVLAFLQSLESCWRDLKVVAKDGSLVESSWANIRLSDATRISIGIDLRERKKAVKALKDANKKLNLLTSITRHDILNQITALKAFLVLLEEQHHGTAEAMEMFCNLEKIADTIHRQITFTGNYQEMGERDPEWLQVAWVVKRAAQSVRLNGTALAVDTGALEIFADPMLEKVFYDLLDNAVVHGERVEHIRVTFHENGGAGVLLFEDDGVGVPASSKDKIFERGFGKVTGYGLFLVKEILDITSLSIRETGEEGSGARFEIEVPAGKWRMGEH